MRLPVKNGFTLIELSIVLVIIGLIVGGVLVGRDLIEAAKIRSQIKQVQDFASAMNVFRTKYNGLPGDISAQQATNFGLTHHVMWAPDNAYTNNGRIDDSSGNMPAIYIGNEPWSFSYDLIDAQLLPNNVTTISSNNVSFYPPIAANPAAGIIISGYKDSVWLFLGKTVYYNGSWIGGHSPTGIGALSPAQSYSIDSKMDDGNPSTGNVLMVDVPGLLPATDKVASQCVTDTTGTVYNVTDSKIWCKPFINLK